MDAQFTVCLRLQKAVAEEVEISREIAEPRIWCPTGVATVGAAVVLGVAAVAIVALLLKP